MTTAAGVRGLYAALGIELPDHATREASVRCFANPDAHSHGDRHRSMSISVVNGAYYCHGCLASGGAYDACLNHGLDPRAAIELMIDHGLTQRRSPGARHRPHTTPARPRRPRRSITSPQLAVDDRQIVRWAAALQRDDRLLERLDELGYDREVLADHQIGSHEGRLTIPARDHDGTLLALLRYLPPPRVSGAPKMLAVPGSRRALFPHPATQPAGPLLIVEGHPDALQALSHGLPASAIPGHGGWHPHWAPQLTGRKIRVCLDCDPPGRAGAQRIARDITAAGGHAKIVDLDPDRHDGYDLTDHLTLGHTLPPAAR